MRSNCLQPTHPPVAAVGCALLLLALPTAGWTRTAGGSLALLPPIADGEGDASRVAAIGAAIGDLAEVYEGMRVVAPTTLRRKLGDAAAATGGCNDDIRCLTRLGRKAGAGIIVVARVATSARTIRVRLFALEVSSRRLVGSALWTVQGGAVTAAALRPHIDALLGIASRAAALDMEFPELAPVPMVSAAAVESADPTDVDGTATSGSHDGMIAAAPVHASSTPVEPGAVAPAPNGSAALRPLRLAAYGGVGVGAVLMALSGYYGLRYRSSRDAIDADGPRTTSLPEAIRLERDANLARGRAGWLLLSGGLTALSGGILLLVDLNLEAAATVRVALSVDGSQVCLRTAW